MIVSIKKNSTQGSLQETGRKSTNLRTNNDWTSMLTKHASFISSLHLPVSLYIFFHKHCDFFNLKMSSRDFPRGPVVESHLSVWFDLWSEKWELHTAGKDLHAATKTRPTQPNKLIN